MFKPEWDSKAERDLWASACKESFWLFIQYAWGMNFWALKGDEHPLLTPRIHKPLCDWYQEHALRWLKTRERTSLMVTIPRFFGKTSLITKAGQVWLHLHDPDLATYTGSENFTRSAEFLGSVSKVLNGDDPFARFTWLYGNWYDKRREWRRDGLNHAARRAVSRTEYSMGTWSVEKGITGHHPDAGFLDDPTSYESMGMHNNWFTMVNDHLASLLPVFADNSLFVIVGTRYGDGDHIGKQLRTHGAKSWSGMPAPKDQATMDGLPVVRDDGEWHVYFLSARDENGAPTFPERCSEKFLQKFSSEQNLRYHAQMLNDPSGSELNPLTREQIEQLWIDKSEVPRNLRTAITIDTAFKDQNRTAKGDESVMIVWGLPRDDSGDRYFLEGYGSNIWRMEDFLTKLVDLIKKYKLLGKPVRYITDEPEPGGKTRTWEYAIRTACNAANIHGIPPLIYLPRTRAKESRVIQAASYWTEGYVRLVRDAPGVHRLVDQMTRVGMGGLDDWRDAAADIFAGKVYTPPGKPEKALTEADLRRPGDDVLKPGLSRISEEQARRVYDEYWEESEGGWEPI